jgi:hypothetical protein
LSFLKSKNGLILLSVVEQLGLAVIRQKSISANFPVYCARSNTAKNKKHRNPAKNMKRRNTAKKVKHRNTAKK